MTVNRAFYGKKNIEKHISSHITVHVLRLGVCFLVGSESKIGQNLTTVDGEQGWGSGESTSLPGLSLL